MNQEKSCRWNRDFREKAEIVISVFPDALKNSKFSGEG
jgi:hypothetical protein